MPLDERQQMSVVLKENVTTEDLTHWRNDFLDALHGVPVSTDHEAERETARSVYDEHRHYHGTGEDAKQSIRTHGFRHDRKTAGGSSIVRAGFQEGSAAAAVSYHYLTADKRTASRYARTAKSGGPALVRTLGVREDIPVERVMGVDRTASDIPPRYVIGSKKADPGAESAVFRQALSRAGMEVSEERAGSLLRDAQSDSESDFPAA
jgi:type III effector protein AvrRpm1